GNGAQFAVEKVMQLGGRVICVSDSAGSVYDAGGFTAVKLARLMKVIIEHYSRVSQYAEEAGVQYLEGKTPWHLPMDVALPCATQNELNEEDALMLVKNGVQAVAEGANMPCTAEAVTIFEKNGVLYAPGKA